MTNKARRQAIGRRWRSPARAKGVRRLWGDLSGPKREGPQRQKSAPSARQQSRLTNIHWTPDQVAATSRRTSSARSVASTAATSAIRLERYTIAPQGQYDPKAVSRTVEVFPGVSVQCAAMPNNPFDTWTQGRLLRFDKLIVHRLSSAMGVRRARELAFRRQRTPTQTPTHCSMATPGPVTKIHRRRCAPELERIQDDPDRASRQGPARRLGACSGRRRTVLFARTWPTGRLGAQFFEAASSSPGMTYASSVQPAQ